MLFIAFVYVPGRRGGASECFSLPSRESVRLESSALLEGARVNFTEAASTTESSILLARELYKGFQYY